MTGPKHRPPPHLGDPPVLPLASSANGKGWNRRPARIPAAAEARAWRRMQAKCPGCGWLCLRGSTTCCKCGHTLPAGKKEK